MCGCQFYSSGELRKRCEIHSLRDRDKVTVVQLECGQCHGKGAAFSNGTVISIEHAVDCKRLHEVA
jgi:hypothetical protein